jgi:hypothetical protein
MALEHSQENAVLLPAQGLPEALESSTKHISNSTCSRKQRVSILSLRKTPAVIETIIAAEGHGLNLYASCSFGVLGDILSLF